MTEYICLHCFHRWYSSNSQRVLRCSSCHRRQGVRYDKFFKAVRAASTALRKVAESPPPYRPPFDVIQDIPNVLDMVIEVAKEEFPSPLIPVTLFKGILTAAIAELRNEAMEEACD